MTFALNVLMFLQPMHYCMLLIRELVYGLLVAKGHTLKKTNTPHTVSKWDVNSCHL